MRSLFFLLFTLCLYSQEFIPTYTSDRELTLHDFSVYEWNPKKKAFSAREDLPSIPRTFRGRAAYQYDGQHLYIVESHPNVMGVVYGFSMMTPTGPQWYLHPVVTIKGNLRLLVADDLQVVVERITRPEGKNPGKYQILSLDLTSEKLTTMFEDDFRPALQAVAAVKDRLHHLFLSDGRVLEMDAKFGGLKEVASRFWQNLSDRWTDHVETPDGKIIPQPPMFPGNPFFSRDGDIFVPMVIREKNRWTRAMSEAAWAEASEDAREWAIKHGMWPPKAEPFEGSDNVLVMLRYHPDTRKTTVVPVDQYEWLVERSPHVKQARLAKFLPNSLIFDDKEGVVEIRRLLESSAPVKSKNPAPAKQTRNP